jgi:hypothetical protein
VFEVWPWFILHHQSSEYFGQIRIYSQKDVSVRQLSFFEFYVNTDAENYKPESNQKVTHEQ